MARQAPGHDVLVLFEHPEWQKPLFAALETAGVAFTALDLKRAAFEPGATVDARLVFNQASPSAYVRGNARAVPFALAYLKALEHADVPVINGARAFALELSKTAQCAMLGRLGIRTPRSITFNDVDALDARVKTDAAWRWPALLKPEQGGSGARIEKVGSVDEVRALLAADPRLWEPDGPEMHALASASTAYSASLLIFTPHLSPPPARPPNRPHANPAAPAARPPRHARPPTSFQAARGPAWTPR